ncbi:type IV secretory system conjugative DNA transfer family protein [Halocatena halophila]|uniref:hypothetical protein n=1 Tax=Halocatena halophila TaxID=2814576 RepID=UPI002ED2BE0B
MGILDRLQSTQDSTTAYKPLRIDESLATAATEKLPDGECALVVRPYRDNGGIPAMDEVLTALHEVKSRRSRSLRNPLRGKRENVSAAHTAEIRYGPTQTTTTGPSERVITLQYIPAQEYFETFRRQLENKYPNSEIKARNAGFLDVSPGKYLAGSTLALRRYTLYPINNIALDGFRSDPIGAILQEIVGTTSNGSSAETAQNATTETDVAVQLMFQPADRSWLQGVPNGGGIADGHGDRDWDGGAVGTPIEGVPSVQDLTYQLRQKTIERHNIFGIPFGPKEVIEHPPSKRDKDVARMLEEQDGKAWRLFVRIFAISDDPDEAAHRVKRVAGMFRNYYEFRSEQTFLPEPITGSNLATQFERACGRVWEDAGIVKTQPEASGLLNVPRADDITTNRLQWSLSRPGDGVPVGTPRFDFDAVDLPDDPTSAEKQVAMLDHSEPGDPFWFGFGRRNGTEVGVYEEYLNAHMLVTGGTRKGKTTTLGNLASQVYDRDYGALIIAKGKQDDDERFIEEWPEDRPEEDFVFIDTGGEFDKRVRFNLLEVPSNAEPGTNAFESAVHALADDWGASFAEAGGSDKYWGAVMERVTRTVINGLARSGLTATPLDVAGAIGAAAGIDTFSELISDERMPFVKDAAERIREKEDSDLEPLAGRTDMLTQHAGIRNFLCARNPSASIQELVREGKVCVLRLDPHLGESEIKFMLTPLVRRFYTAKRTLPDAPRFYLIWDEFDKGVSPLTNVHEMLSIAGGHDFRMILACQAPSNQLYGKLKNALQNQVDTAISFGTGEKDAGYILSHHSLENTSDLTNLGRFKFWLRTYYQTDDDEDTTYSYKVDAFPPSREIRQEVHGDDYEVDVKAMKRRSVERFGDVPESAEELREESRFYDGEETDVDDPQQLDEIDFGEPRWRNQVLKAITDESIRQGSPHDYVAVRDCLDRLRRYLPGGGALRDANQVWRKVLQHVPDAYLNYREEDDEIFVQATDTGFMNVGGSETAGGKDHQRLMEDAYVPFTQLGFLFEILDQDADSMPDALATLDDQLYLDGVEDPKTIADRVNSFRENHPELFRLAGVEDVYIEAEHSTGETQPSQTIINLVSAHNADRRCVFLCRLDAAKAVWTTLCAGDEYCHSNHSIDEERRFYTMTRNLMIDGEKMTRPGAAANIWVHDRQTGQYILRDTDGTEHARFNTAAEIFTDASQYPAGGERNIKPPVIPEYEFDGKPSTAEWDIIVVPEAEVDENDERRLLTPLDLTLYRHDQDNIPLCDLPQTVAEEDVPKDELGNTTNRMEETSDKEITEKAESEEVSDDTDAASQREPRKFERF